ncbi:MAG: radical SAM protein [Candidatus Eremiobacteraeota bacterium]|nr:radical SAM protein [Candidatus Eremiobacteraeota bacterium]
MSKYLFGPVPSRRLGRSLGIDTVKFKTCSYDCIYCQLGRTTFKTITRAEYVPTTEILDELKNFLEKHESPDYITLSGSGEPTLHSGLKEIISNIRELTEIPVAVLTNGSMLWDPEVRFACCLADLVIPSLDAGDPEIFQVVNRPHPDLDFYEIFDGLCNLRDEFHGKIWLEVFLVENVNDSLEQVNKIKKLADKFRPDKIQLNTAVRPPAEKFVKAVPHKRLEYIRGLIGDNAEIVVPHHGESSIDFGVKKEDVLSLVSRRPCSIDDIARGLGMHKNEVIKYIQILKDDGLIKSRASNGIEFYYN